MKECIAAIHFLDSSPGPMGSASGSGDGPFPLKLQLDVGRTREAQHDEFFQISWAGPQRELEERDPERRLKALVRNRPYWDFLRSVLDTSNTDSVNDFSDRVLLSRLEQVISKKPTVIDDDEEYIRQRGKPVACIVHEKNDRDVALKAVDYLRGRGWRVHFPEPGKAKEEFSKKNAFAIFFYWGSGSQVWCKGNFKDLRQQRTLLNSLRPPWAIAVYLGADFVPDKEDVKRENTLCPGEWPCFTDGDFNDFNPANVPARLEEFVAMVEALAQEEASQARAAQI
jgi:hypothetical protein